MTKARTIADLGTGFVNITDTVTEGTRLATGTTAQRGSTQGQFRFNTTTGKFEGRNATSFVEIDATPVVSSIAVNNITAAQIAANYDLVITGSNFEAGDTVKFVGNDGTEYAAPVVTVNSATQITARVASTVTNANEPFDVKVISAIGKSGLLANAFNVDGAPVWTTAAGNIGSVDILDIAPTMMKILDVPIPDDLQGKPIDFE